MRARNERPAVGLSRHNFAQVEDFNTKKTDKDKAYQKEYMKRMGGEGMPRRRPPCRSALLCRVPPLSGLSM